METVRRSGRSTAVVAASSGLVVTAATVPNMAAADTDGVQPQAAGRQLIQIEPAQQAKVARPALGKAPSKRLADVASRGSAFARSASPSVQLARQTAQLSTVAEPIQADIAVDAVPAFGGGLGFEGVTPEPEPEEVERSTLAASTGSSDDSSSDDSGSDDSGSDYGGNAGVIGIAKQYLGVPYVYGGSTPSGFDCSGFTSYVFRKVGISLPRTARDQARSVNIVSNPRPGDLVFFNSPATHVGIYLGNGMMIDAPKPGLSVEYNSLKYRSNYYFGRP